MPPAYWRHSARERLRFAIVHAWRSNDTTPQAEMQNSVQQYGNIADAFVVDGPVPDGPAFLIDDLADSRRTLAVARGCARQAAGRCSHWCSQLARGSEGPTQSSPSPRRPTVTVPVGVP